jgi:hypothetical protein
MVAGDSYATLFEPAYLISVGSGWWLINNDSTASSFAKGPREPAPPDNEVVQLFIPSRIVDITGSPAALPTDLIGWFRARPDLVITAQRPASAGGASGTMLNGSVKPGVETAHHLICAAASQCGPQNYAETIGFGSGRTFRLYFLDVHGQQVVLAADADTATWTTGGAILDAFIRGLTFLRR